MLIALEALGWLVFIGLMLWPLWIHNNWRVIFFPTPEEKAYIKSYQQAPTYASVSRGRGEPWRKNCTYMQPAPIGENKFVICNFPCDGQQCPYTKLNLGTASK